MLDEINKKLRRMYASLVSMQSDDLSIIQPKIHERYDYIFVEIDFNENSNEIDLMNLAFQLIANIASLKDHLKEWCKQQQIPFQGEMLINTNKSAAIIHDLWNIDKHYDLDKPPRSGIKPKLQDIRKVLRISSGNGGGGASFFMNPNRDVTYGTTGNGNLQHTLSAQIVDDSGNFIADLMQTCTEAIEAWESTFNSSGVTLP